MVKLTSLKDMCYNTRAGSIRNGVGEVMRTLRQVINELNNRPIGYYVYVLYDYEREPFYVGMATIRTDGKGQRILGHEREARAGVKSAKADAIRDIWAQGGTVSYEIDSYPETLDETFKRERELIGLIGRADLGVGPLTNHTCGADGAFNVVLTPEQRSRRGAASKTAEFKERITLRHADPAFKEFHGAATRDGMNTPEAKAKMVAAKLGTKFDADRLARHRAAYQEPDVAQTMSAASYQRWSDPDYKKRRADQQRAFQERRRFLVAACVNLLANSGLAYSLPSGRENLAAWEQAFAELSARSNQGVE